MVLSQMVRTHHHQEEQGECGRWPIHDSTALAMITDPFSLYAVARLLQVHVRGQSRHHRRLRHRRRNKDRPSDHPRHRDRHRLDPLV